MKRARQAEQPSGGVDTDADADKGATVELHTPEGSPLAAAVWEHGLEVRVMDKTSGGVGVCFLAVSQSSLLHKVFDMIAAACKQLCIAMAAACSCVASALPAGPQVKARAGL